MQGLGYWANLVDGGNSRTTEVFNIENSHEFRLVEIQGFFRQYLRRGADPSALAADETFLINGGTPEQLAIELVASDEYCRGRAGSGHQSFLNALYADALLPSADQNAVNFYVNQDFTVESVRTQAARRHSPARSFTGTLSARPAPLASSMARSRTDGTKPF